MTVCKDWIYSEMTRNLYLRYGCRKLCRVLKDTSLEEIMEHK